MFIAFILYKGVKVMEYTILGFGVTLAILLTVDTIINMEKEGI